MAEPISFTTLFDAVTDKLVTLDEQARQRYRAAADATRTMQNMTASAEADGGAIAVTVSSTGALTHLAMTEHIRQWSATTISAKVLACVQRAQARLADQAAETMAAIMPEDDRMTNLVVGQLRHCFPAPGPPEPGPPTRAEAPRTPSRRPPVAEDEDGDFGDESIMRKGDR